ncbi:MAG: MBL fold metallo-hydrolase [Acholeplasmatales bacterium]|nr:MBL fold metallo-hydrolase [Acholeplasmatales bacterium]
MGRKRKVNKAKKLAKKYPKIVIGAIIFLAIVIVVLYILHMTHVITIPFLIKNETEEVIDDHNHGEVKEDGIVENIKYDEFSIHFMELGNEFAGDSVYIKAGDVDILIDAGSRGNSAPFITEYVDKYCTDGKLEYVIATHNHQDHIAGFAGNSSAKAKNFKGDTVGKTGILYYYDVETLIDFTYATITKKVDGKNKDFTYLNKEQNSSDFGSSTVYGKYLEAREYAISKGTKYFTAKDLWDNNNHLFNLTSSITMDVLYNYYYFNESSDVNNYSVCTLFTYNEKSYLLTGDLEKEGEEKLENYYDGSTKEKTLPHVELFKAGHHGSYTASNECLLEKVAPKMCVACCCCGSTEYTIDNDHIFPAQEFIDRIAKYTSRVYITSLYDKENDKGISMNGNVVVSSNGLNVGLYASNNLIRLKDTSWFNEDIYVVNGKVRPSSSGEFYKEGDPGVSKIKQRTWPSYGVA